MDAELEIADWARVEELLEDGLKQARCLGVAFSQMTSKLPEQPTFRKYRDRAIIYVRKNTLSELRELGHRCECDVGVFRQRA